MEPGLLPGRRLANLLAPWAAVPPALLLAATGVLWYLDLDRSYESRQLLTVLNFTFVTCTSGFVALLAGRTFVATGAPGSLFLGSGVLVMGAAFVAAALAGGQSPNVTATVHNTGMLAAGLASLVGAWMSYRPRAPVRAPVLALGVAYAAALGFVLGTTYLAVGNATPTFFVQGTGGTPLRQIVLATSVALFGAAGLFLVLVNGEAATFRRWYALGLVLLGVGLVGILFQPALGSPISWVGRIAQYLGGVYLLVASLTSSADARQWALPLEAELREERTQAQQLREARAQLARVLEGSNDGFWDWNIQTGQVEFSDRWAAMFGYRLSELAPSVSTWEGMLHPDDRESARGAQKRIVRGEMERHEAERRLRHKDGHWVWVLVRGKIVERNADGKPTRMAGTYTDISERKQVEEALRDREARLRAFFQSPSVGIAITEAGKGFVEVNDHFCAMLGYTREELLGVNWRELTHPDDVATDASEVGKLLSGESETYSRDKRYIRKDGTVLWVRLSASCTRRHDRSVESIVAIAKDISERKVAEEALAAAHRQLKQHVTNTPLALIEWDGAYRVTRFTARATEMFGWLDHEVLGKRIDEAPWVPEEDGPKARAIMDDVAAGARPSRVSLDRSVRKDGKVIHCEWYNSSLYGRDGKLVSVFSLVQDVTARQEAVAALHASEAKYRGLFNSLMDGFVVVGMDGVIRESNETYRKMLGYSAEELVRMTYRDLTPERWHPLEARVVAEQVLPRGYSDVYEKEYRRKDGTVFPVELRTFLLKEGGRPVAMWAIVRDVTETRALQMKLTVAGRMSALGTLVSGVAHEINNPLSAEMADQGIALEVVREVRERLRGDSPIDRGTEGRALDGVVEALEDAQAGGARIARIVKDLTVFGRPDTRRQPARLMDIIDGAMRWLPATVARTASIRVENGGAPDVVASAGQIEQILVNLVSNAAKATPEGQRDTVVVRVGPGPPGTARVEVIDHGIGIDPTIRDHIFDPFFTTRPVGPGRGSGLGLAICQSIATAHGGSLTFESEVGKGSTFRLELPAAPAHEDPPGDEAVRRS